MNSLYILEESLSNGLQVTHLDKAIIPYIRQHCRLYNLQKLPKSTENIIYQYAFQPDNPNLTTSSNTSANTSKHFQWREILTTIQNAGFSKAAVIDSDDLIVIASTNKSDFPNEYEIKQLSQSWYQKRLFTFFQQTFSSHDFEDKMHGCSWWIGSNSILPAKQKKKDKDKDSKEKEKEKEKDKSVDEQMCLIACKFVKYHSFYLVVSGPMKNFENKDDTTVKTVKKGKNKNAARTAAARRDILRRGKNKLFEECGISSWWSNEWEYKGQFASKAGSFVKYKTEKKEKEVVNSKSDEKNKTEAWVDDEVTLVIELPFEDINTISDIDDDENKNENKNKNEMRLINVALSDSISQIKTRIYNCNKKYHIGKQKLYFNHVEITNLNDKSLYQCCIENNNSYIFERDERKNLIIRLSLNRIVIKCNLSLNDKIRLMTSDIENINISTLSFYSHFNNLNISDEIKNDESLDGGYSFTFTPDVNTTSTVETVERFTFTIGDINRQLNQYLTKLGSNPNKFIHRNLMVDYIELEVINDDGDNNKNEIIVNESNEISIEYKTNIISVIAVNQDIANALNVKLNSNLSMNNSNYNEMLLYVPNKIDRGDFVGLVEKRMVSLYYSKLITNNEGSSRTGRVIPRAMIGFQAWNSSQSNINSQSNQSTQSTFKEITKHAQGELLDGTKINYRTNIVIFDVDFCNFGAKWNNDGNRSADDDDEMKQEKGGEENNVLRLIIVAQWTYLDVIKDLVCKSQEYKDAVTKIPHMSLESKLPFELFVHIDDSEDVNIQSNHNNLKSRTLGQITNEDADRELIKNGSIIECRSGAIKLFVTMQKMDDIDIDNNDNTNNNSKYQFSMFVSPMWYLESMIHVLHEQAITINTTTASTQPSSDESIDIPWVKQIRNLKLHSIEGQEIMQLNPSRMNDNYKQMQLNECGFSDRNCIVTCIYRSKIIIQCYRDTYTENINDDHKQDFKTLTVRPDTTYGMLSESICNAFDMNQEAFVGMEQKISKQQQTIKDTLCTFERVNPPNNATNLFEVLLDGLEKSQQIERNRTLTNKINSDTGNDDVNKNKNENDKKEFESSVDDIITIVAKFRKVSCLKIFNDIRMKQFKKMLKLKQLTNNVIIWLSSKDSQFGSGKDKILDTLSNATDLKKGVILTFKDDKNCIKVMESIIDYNLKLVTNKDTNDNNNNNSGLIHLGLIVEQSNSSENFVQSLVNGTFGKKFESFTSTLVSDKNDVELKVLNVLVYCMSKIQRKSAQQWVKKMNEKKSNNNEKNNINMFVKAVMQQKSVVEFVRNHC